MGAVGRRAGAFEKALAAAGLAGSPVCWTEGPRHAADLSRRLAAEVDAVVAVGGDGTVHEVAEGLVAAGGGAALGVVAVGTGNDFVKMLGLPAGLGALAALEAARVQRVDYGLVRWMEGGAWHEGFFCNGLGMGFDARVAALAPRYKRLPGAAAYVCAALDTLVRWQSPAARLVADGAVLLDAPFLLAAVGNGTTAGGGFILTPQAAIADGRLDLCAIRAASRLRILQLLPAALRARHVEAPEVSLHLFTTLALETDAPIALHADGEVIAQETQRVEVAVRAAGLPVLMAAGALRR